MSETFDSTFLDSLVPSNFNYRDNQKDIVKDVLEAFQEYDYVCLNAPTGSGKSIIALSVANSFNGATILTSSKVLQEQYINDFPFLKSFKGKDNYICHNDENNETTADCNRKPDEKCPGCDYEKAKEFFSKKYNIGIGNYWSYFFLNHKNPVSKDLLVVDECHNIEDIDINFHSLSFNPELLIRTGIVLPTDNSFELLDYHEVENSIKIISDNLKSCLNDEQKKKFKGKKNKYKSYRMKQISLNNYDFQTCFVYIDKYGLHFSINNPESYVQRDLFESHKKVLLMSATVDKNFISNSLDVDKVKFIDVPGVFPAENRKVQFITRGNFNYGVENRPGDIDILIDLLNKICFKHPGERGIVHTISHRMMNLIRTNAHRLVEHERFIFVTGMNPIDDALVQHRNSVNGILVGANFTEGQSFDDDRARFQILIKLPYPSRGTPYAQYKAENDDKWTHSKVTLGLNQIYGRVVRNKHDYAKTYILGKNARKSLYYLDATELKYFMEGVKGKLITGKKLNVLYDENTDNNLFKKLGASVDKDGYIVNRKRQVIGNFNVIKRAINGSNKLHFMTVNSYINNLAKIDKIAIDLDFTEEYDNDKREEITLGFIDYLKNKYSLDHIYSHSSGGKGYHIYIPLDEAFIIDMEYRQNFASVMQGLCDIWVNEYPEIKNIIDYKVTKDIKRVLRIPFITRFDTGALVGDKIYKSNVFNNIYDTDIDKNVYLHELFNISKFNYDLNIDIKDLILKDINEKNDIPKQIINKFIRSDRPEITELLDLVIEPDGTLCLCPFHDDHNPSAFIIRDNGFAWGLSCHACNKIWYTFFDYNSNEWIVKERI